jgi:hypothetical protein
VLELYLKVHHLMLSDLVHELRKVREGLELARNVERSPKLASHHGLCALDKDRNSNEKNSWSGVAKAAS